MTDNLRCEVSGNKVNGYRVDLYDGDVWEAGRGIGAYDSPYMFRWTARRAARRWLKSLRKAKDTRHTEIIR